jgi:trehalose/maltose hydrolase-like predicted phosphorylase
MTYNRERDRYEIRNVVSVNESLIGVDNDAHTNAVAAKNLELAIAAAKVVGAAPNPEWANAARKLYVPPTPILFYTYPLERPASAEEKRKVLDATLLRYAPRQAGVMMEITFYPIIAVEAGSTELLEKSLPLTYQPYLAPPFNVLREAPGNENINFLTGAGGFLQQFVFGYPGLRFSDEGLTHRYAPLLPKLIESLSLKNATVRGKLRNINVGGTKSKTQVAK